MFPLVVDFTILAEIRREITANLRDLPPESSERKRLLWVLESAETRRAFMHGRYDAIAARLADRNTEPDLLG